MTFDSKGIFEWDIIIEKACPYIYVGVCSPENFNYETHAGSQPTGWVLGSSGYCWNSCEYLDYCPIFGDGAKITVHLNMNKRTFAFIVNGRKYPEVPGWSLPSRICPVVSLCQSGRVRIQVE